MDILIAEDSDVTNLMLTETLTDWGYNVISVKDGDAAWDVLSKPNAPKLCILDWMMPGLSGVDICKKLRENDDSSYYYVILLTSKTDKDQVYSGLSSGADDYLAKPYDPAELKLRLEIGQRVLKLERELLDAMSQLKEQEERQNEFFAALTHDLRTPLIAEKRALSVINELSPLHWPFQLPTLVNSLTTNNNNLLELVNQLLEKFHLEASPSFKGDRVWVDPKELVVDCFEALRPLATEKNIKMFLHAGSEPNLICVNPTEMKRVFTNLIANAVQYDPLDTMIEVTISSKNETVEIIISDNGTGIDSEKLPYIFERYYSGNQNHKVGSGLGLNVCKNIIEHYNGSIRVEAAENIGTIFYITFPSYTAVEPKSTKDTIRVLIVDDQELSRLGFQHMLRNLEGFKVVGLAENGVKAYSKAAQLKPDVILMDIKMPEMDGYTATHVIKAANPEIKIVMLSALQGNGEVTAALNAGADGYCTKDISAFQLGEALRAVVEGHQWIDPVLQNTPRNSDSLFAA